MRIHIKRIKHRGPTVTSTKPVLEKTLESPLHHKEIQTVHPRGNQSWIFIGRTDVEAETPILWPLDAKNWLLGKDSDAGKDWRREEKGTTEDEMVGWHYQLNGHEFELASGLVKDREAWRTAVHGVAKSWTWLSKWIEQGHWIFPAFIFELSIDSSWVFNQVAFWLELNHWVS